MIPLALAAAALSLGVPQCSAPAARNPAGNYIVPGVLGDVAYGSKVTLDAYAPPGEPRPAAIIIHGSHGNKRTHITQLFDVLDRAGYAWFSVDSRSADDVADAVRYVRCPGRFNITQKFVLVGVDNGAQLLLEPAKDGASTVLRFTTGWGGNIGSSTGLTPTKFPDDLQELVMLGARFSPGFLQSTEGGPGPHALTLPAVPVLMLHGTSDDEFPASQAESLCERMLHCVFEPVPGGIHELENWHPDQWFWKEDLTAWLRGDRRGLWKDITYARPDGLPLLMDAYIPEGEGLFRR
jgi:fermentation-respiration switch protein FrsA (DUF1100 family)